MAAIELNSTSLLAKATAYYRMEDATDTKGSYNLTVTGATLAAAKFNNGYSFSGSGQYALCSIPAPSDSFTVVGWVNATDLADYRILMGWSDATATKYGFVGIKTPSNKAFCSIDGITVYVESTSTPATGELIFIAGRFDNAANTLAVWLNSEKTSIACATTPNLAGTSCGVGCMGAYRDSALMKGQLDDVAYFDSALTDAEISNLYTGNWSTASFLFNLI